MCQDWGLAWSPCLSGLVTGREVGEMAEEEAEEPDISPILPPDSTAHDPHPQLPGAPSELGKLTGPCSGPPGLPENCLLYWNVLTTPPTTTHTIPPDGVT